VLVGLSTRPGRCSPPSELGSATSLLAASLQPRPPSWMSLVVPPPVDQLTCLPDMDPMTWATLPCTDFGGDKTQRLLK
jgi:hypothetical protein